MKAKIAQKRKIAETKLAKSMRNEIEERRKRAQERALNSKFKVQRPEKKHKSLLLEETSDHKAKSRISKFEEKPPKYPDSLPSVSSSEYVPVSTSDDPVVKRVTWPDKSGGLLTDVRTYPLSLAEMQQKKDNATAVRESISPAKIFTETYWTRN